MEGMQPGLADRLLATAFHSCPELISTTFALHLERGQASSAAALRSLCYRLAALPGQVRSLSLEWPANGLEDDLEESAAHILSALAPLRGRISHVDIQRLRVARGDVTALAAAVGPELRELCLLFAWSVPVGEAAVEAVAGLPGMRELVLPITFHASTGWEPGLVQACEIAQTDARRTDSLCTHTSGREVEAMQGWLTKAWAALPQPQTGPIRVFIV